MNVVQVPVDHDAAARATSRDGREAAHGAQGADYVAVVVLAVLVAVVASSSWNRWVGLATGPSVGVGLAVAIACLGLTYAVARHLLAPLPAALAAVLMAGSGLSPSTDSFVVPSTLASPMGVLLALTAVLAAARAAATGARRWLVAIGACLGLTVLTTPLNALAVTLAVGGWLAVRTAVAGPDGRRRALGDIAVVLLSALALAAAGHGTSVVSGVQIAHPPTPHALAHDGLVPAGPLRGSPSFADDHVIPAPSVGGIAALAAKAALYVAVTGALMAIGLTLAGREPWRRAVLGGAVLVVAVAAVVVAGRPSAVRPLLGLVFAWMPAAALIAALLLAWLPIRLKARAWSPAAQVQLLVALMAVGLTAGSVLRVAVHPGPTGREGAAYAMPLFAILLAWMHVRVVPRVLPLGAASVRAVGLGWLVLLAACWLALLVHDAGSPAPVSNRTAAARHAAIPDLWLRRAA